MNDFRIKSHIEEALATLWFIVGFLALNYGWAIFGYVAIGYASFNILASIYYSLKDPDKGV